MVDRDNVLRLAPSLLPYRRIHENASAERVLAPVILPFIAPPIPYSRRAKDRDHSASLADINTLLRGLVRSQDVRHPRRVQEVMNGPVSVADRSGASLALAEPRVVQPLLLLVLRGVRPQQVVRQLLDLLGPLVRGRHAHRRGAGDLVDALQRALRRRERPRNAAVHAEDHVVDGGREGKAVEHRVGLLPEILPDVRPVAGFQLAQEAAVAEVRFPTVYRAQLVIAAEQEDLVGKHDFLREEVGENLDGVLAAVDVVAEEEEAARGEVHAQGPQDLRERDQIGDVPVEITKNVYRRFQLEQARLGGENIF